MRATRSSWRRPRTAPRMRSRTPSVVRSLEPFSLKASAEPASRTNWRVGTRPAERAVRPMMNADEPAISVRSRSKNAALGPAADHAAVRVGVGRRVGLGRLVQLDVVEAVGLLTHGARLEGGLLRVRAARHGSPWSAAGFGGRQVVRHTSRDAEPPGDRGRGVAARRAGRQLLAERRPHARRPSAPRRRRERRRRRRRTRRAARRARRRRACRGPPSRRASSARAPRVTRRSGPNACGEVGHRALDAVRGLVQHDRARLGRQLGQAARRGRARCAAGSPRTRTGRWAAR